MGSIAYGVSTDVSDIDVYGYAIPPKDNIFPHLSGEIRGFGEQIKPFEQYQKHHVKDISTEKEYDFCIFSIVKYFNLVMQNNPNMIDSLYVPRTCVIHSTELSEHVRESRSLFLHKGSYKKFKSYAYSQLHKARIKVPKEDSNRYDDYIKNGYSTKFIYHLARLVDECEQILTTHTLDLQRNREQLKAIRRGDWTLERAEKYFELKEKQLEEMFLKSSLQENPPEDKIKQLLLDCLEIHYGSLSTCIKIVPDIEKDMKRIAEITSKYH